MAEFCTVTSIVEVSLPTAKNPSAALLLSVAPLTSIVTLDVPSPCTWMPSTPLGATLLLNDPPVTVSVDEPELFR